jgi:hypothetical protein
VDDTPRRLPDPGATTAAGAPGVVVRIRRSSASPTSVKASGKFVWRTGEQLFAQNSDRLAAEADLPPPSDRLGRYELSFARSGLDDHAPAFEIDGALAKGEELELSETGQASEADEVAVRLDRRRGERVDLLPVEEAHLGSLPARRPDPEARAIDNLAALLRRAQDHLQGVEHQLGGPRRALRHREDVILDVGRQLRDRLSVARAGERAEVRDDDRSVLERRVGAPARPTVAKSPAPPQSRVAEVRRTRRLSSSGSVGRRRGSL